MAKAAKRKIAKKPAAKTVARRKPVTKPKPRRKRAMATDKTDYTPAPKAAVTPTVAAPGDMMTEQEKDTSAGVHGVGPVVPAAHTTGPVETIEDLGIGPREPYPEGNSPADTEVITRSQGINKGDQPDDKVAPNKTTKKG